MLQLQNISVLPFKNYIQQQFVFDKKVIRLVLDL